jgi:hypothetical protein
VGDDPSLKLGPILDALPGDPVSLRDHEDIPRANERGIGQPRSEVLPRARLDLAARNRVAPDVHNLGEETSNLVLSLKREPVAPGVSIDLDLVGLASEQQSAHITSRRSERSGVLAGVRDPRHLAVDLHLCLALRSGKLDIEQEGKVVKNRLHLDVRVGTGLVGEERLGTLEDECARLVALGAVRVRLLPADEDNESCIVMQDIEGNEFDLD